MKYVLIYESPPDLDMENLRAHFPAHRARWAAEEFAATDPFVLNGLVAKWHIQAWNEALLEPL